MIVFDPGSNCSWCGHAWPHPLPCPGLVVVGRGRYADERRECPCKRDGGAK